jgi:hypothetical protein
MKLAVLFALIAITLPVPALAADWVQVADAINGDKYYIDRQSIRTTPNGYRRGWIRNKYNTENEFGSTSDKIFYEFDCNEKRKRVLSSIFYKGEEVTSSRSVTGGWDYVPPESVSEVFLMFICRK